MTLVPAVSVVVPFHNAEAHVEDTLSSLIGQSVEGGLEIIAVDNRSRDRSRAIAESFSARLPLRIVDAPRTANLSYARNTGAAASGGAKLMFVDADDTVAPGYVRALSAALDSHRFVTSRVDSSTLNAEWLRLAHGSPWQADGIAVFFDFLPAAGSNIGIRREVYEQLGGFAEHLHGCEDIALSWTAAIELGITPHFVADALYRYRYRSSLRGLYEQARGWGRGQVRLFAHFREHGMPKRGAGAALREWASAVAAFVRPHERRERAAGVVRLGYCAGRLNESIRQRIMFF